jgi:alkanesulfonate monooxygenase SsuD/methylene tetrahydromethanopterin reductase-like flavin-dependent oxidoreductase (luciferase family)
MRLGIAIPAFASDIATPLEAARRAADVGADAVFAVDHLFPPGMPDRPSFEPFSLLSTVAAAERRLGVGLLVTRAGVRPPGLVAKQAAALHDLSEGRAVLAIGMGDALVRPEHDTLGLPYPKAAERAARLEETAAAIRALFEGHRWPGSDHVPALRGPLLPPAAPPVWLGGTGERVVRAAARVADGWNGWGLDADGFDERVTMLREAVAQAGRGASEVAPTWGGIVLVGRDREELARLEEERAARGVAWDPWRGTVEDLRVFADRLRAAGATWMVAMPAGPDDRVELIARTLQAG